MTAPCAPRVAVVGATGAVGRTLLELLGSRAFPCDRLWLVASARSAGRVVEVAGRPHEVRVLDAFDFATVDLAFFSPGTPVSLREAPRAVRQGALVIDNTNAFRMDPATPLVVPQVNGALLARRPPSGIVANPNCSTIPLVRLLRPMHERWQVRRVTVSTYQAAAGRAGIADLQQGSRRVLDGKEDQPSDCFPVPRAFNVVPAIDVLQDTGFTLEEQKMLQESRKILDLAALDLTATCVRVPVLGCHSEAVLVECAAPVDRDELAELLRAAPEVVVHDGPPGGGVPTPRTMDDRDAVHVGRIRLVPGDPRRAWLWLVADNQRVGAALNAVQIAEELLRREVV